MYALVFLDWLMCPTYDNYVSFNANKVVFSQLQRSKHCLADQPDIVILNYENHYIENAHKEGHF